MLERVERLKLLAEQVRVRQLASEAHRLELERLRDLGDLLAAVREAEELQWALTKQAVAEQLLILGWKMHPEPGPEVMTRLVASLTLKPRTVR